MLAENEDKAELLVLGAGTAGARVAYYMMQLGGLPKTRIIAVDTAQADNEMLPGLECITVPEAPIVPVGAAATAACANLKEQLDAYLPKTKMMAVLTFSGGNTGVFYSQYALNAAKMHGIPAIAIIALPHATDSAECHKQSEETLKILHSQGFSYLALDCTVCGKLFPDPREDAAYLQAVRWVAETAMGYLKIFSEDKRNQPQKNGDRHALDFDELPRGIFSILPPTILNGQNLDVPTYIRLRQ